MYEALIILRSLIGLASRRCTGEIVGQTSKQGAHIHRPNHGLNPASTSSMRILPYQPGSGSHGHSNAQFLKPEVMMFIPGLMSHEF